MLTPPPDGSSSFWGSVILLEHMIIALTAHMELNTGFDAPAIPSEAFTMSLRRSLSSLLRITEKTAPDVASGRGLFLLDSPLCVFPHFIFVCRRPV